MAGHSKWNNIKNRKGAQDKKRGKVFSQVSKLIKSAVKEGQSDDPKFNPTLRVALDKARAANMPKDKIQKAIDRGMGRTKDGTTIQEITYEAYGPGGVGMVVLASSDNVQRTASNVKAILSRNGGNLGGPGSVMFMFNRNNEGDFESTMPMELSDQSIINQLENLVELLREDEDVEDIYLAANWEGQDADES